MLLPLLVGQSPLLFLGLPLPLAVRSSLLPVLVRLHHAVRKGIGAFGEAVAGAGALVGGGNFLRRHAGCCHGGQDRRGNENFRTTLCALHRGKLCELRRVHFP